MNLATKNNNNENKSGKTSAEIIKIRIIALIVLLPFVCVLFWALFGMNQDKQDKQDKQDVSAILIKSGKTVNVYALEDCVISDFAISPEQFVEKDFVIARVEQMDLISEINDLLDRNPQDADIAFKRNELLERSLLVSPESGRVVETFVSTGDFVSKGTKIATIFKEAASARSMECLLFVPASKMAKVQKGLSVNIYPSGASVKLYGNMTGLITHVSDFPVTKNYMVNLLGSEALADEFLKNGVVYEIHVALEMSEDTITGYKWTNSSGPSQRFGNLVLCNATIIIEG